MSQHSGEQPASLDPALTEAGRRASRRRELLHGAVVDLRELLESDDRASVEQVRAALERLSATLEAHAWEAETDDGLLAQVVEEDPGFGPRSEAMRREHRELLAECARVRGLLDDEAPAGSTVPGDLLAAVGELAEDVERHRHRSTKLLLDVYQLDLAAGD